MGDHPGQRAGMALLFAVAVLALLALLGTAFVDLQRIETALGGNFVLRTRAQLAAETGIVDALAWIDAHPGVLAPDDARALWADYDHALPRMPDVSELPRPSLADAGDASVSGSVGSTFAANGDTYTLRIEDESGKINLNDGGSEARLRWMLDGDEARQLRGLTGALGLPPMAESIFAAKASLPGGLFTNMTQVRSALLDTAGYTEEQFARLARHVTVYTWQDPDVLAPTFAEPDFTLLAGGGRPMVGDFRFTFGGADAPRAPFLTPAADDGTGIHARPVYLFLDTQPAHFRLEPRAPVNINTCSRAVMEALIAPAQGWACVQDTPESWSLEAWGRTSNNATWDSVRWFNYYPTTARFAVSGWGVKFLYSPAEAQLSIDMREGPDASRIVVPGANETYGSLRQSQPLSPAVTQALVDALWKRVHVEDQPFRVWQEFIDFLYARVEDGLWDQTDPAGFNDGIDDIPGFDLLQAHAIIANANPNSDLNSYNPDSVLYRHIDKSKLNRHTTEFCFECTGTVRIGSLGRIRDSRGAALAEHEINAVTRAYELFRVTTQAQFMAGYTGDAPDPDLLYFDTTVIEDKTLPARANAMVTRSAGAYGSISCATAGANFTSDGDCADPDKRGFSIMSYPEPLTVAPDLANPASANWNPPAWHGPDRAAGESGPSGADAGWTPAMGYADTDWNYLDDSLYDGYLGLATWQPALAEAGALSAIDPQCIVNFNKTLRPVVVPHNAFISKGMIQGWSETGAIVADVHPGYPAHTFTQSMQEAGYAWQNKMAAPDPFRWIGGERHTIHTLATTPQNFPTIDRLTYPAPADWRDPAQRRIPGVLLPDGALSDLGRALTINAQNVGSVDGYVGAIQCWIKPNFDPAFAHRLSTLLRLTPRGPFSYAGNWRLQPAEALECIYFCRRGLENDGAGENSDGELYDKYTPENPAVTWAPVCSIGAAFSHCTASDAMKGYPPSLTGDGGGVFRHTKSANHSYLNGLAGENGIHFDARKWSLLTMTWNLLNNPAPANLTLAVNHVSASRASAYKTPPYLPWPGPRLPGFYRDPYALPSEDPNPSLLGDPREGDSSGQGILGPLAVEPWNYLRLGSPASDGTRNYPADCTYDEVLCYAGRDVDSLNLFRNGRYYNGTVNGRNAPVYTSAEWDLLRRHPEAKMARPRGIAWTLYWPAHTPWKFESGNLYDDEDSTGFRDLASTPVNAVDDNPELPDAAWDPVIADVMTTNNGWLYGGGDADLYDRLETMPTRAAGGALRRTDAAGNGVALRRDRGDKLRFRLMFNVRDGDTAWRNQAVFETPVLDDVTITYTLDRPKILEWTARHGR